MSATFLIALIAALLAIAYWRVVLMVVGAVLIAMIVTGISTVSGAIAGSEQLPTIMAPARPDSSTGGAEADRDTGGTNPDTDPRAQEQPPR